MTTGERILELLPATSRTILRKLRIGSTSTLHKWLSRLRKAGEIHIGRWNRSVGDFVAVWTAGQGPDAARPKRLTPAQITANYRKRKANAAKREERARTDAVKKAEKARFADDPLMALLYRKKSNG